MGRPLIYKFINEESNSKLFSLAICSPRFTDILTAGWVNPEHFARAVAVTPSCLTAQ